MEPDHIHTHMWFPQAILPMMLTFAKATMMVDGKIRALAIQWIGAIF